MRTRFLRRVLYVSCMFGLSALAPHAQGLTTNSAGLVQYQSFQNQTFTLRPWMGTNIALLTPTSLTLDSNVVIKILAALDRAYECYFLANGRKPIAYDPTTLYGRDTISVVPSTCGAGCAYLGFNGIEILDSSFGVLYSGVRDQSQFDQVLFYELGRNFWFYGDKLAYKSPDSDPVVTGYAVYMRFVSMESAGVAGGPFKGYPFTSFLSMVTNLMDSYISSPSLNWSNTFRVSQAPGNPLGLGGTDLIASLLMRISRDFGGPSFAYSFWRQAALRPNASTTQMSVDNFILAACATVGKNLCGVFSETWKFPISAAAHQEAQTRWGDPVEICPTLQITPGIGGDVLLSWQTQVSQAYRVQFTTNLQVWHYVGTPVFGDGTICVYTSPPPGSSSGFFRLNVQRQQ